MKNPKFLTIQISKSWRKDSFQYEEGNIQGRTEFINYSKKEILKEISERMDELQDIYRQNRRNVDNFKKKRDCL